MPKRDINIIRAVQFLRTNYIGAAILETGVMIHMRSDGSALGEDGRIFYAVSEYDENGDCEILGYSSEIKEPLDRIRKN